ncbi:hypothetical protein DYBT9275_00579 [Dyadobacter sp. CECT 9275]|uniref:BlaI/MecI/CopY family transcriptional regulator n=1 Tax=Dyadobacter helix TaxID=2822344 RepID=A0A916J9P7_9BACT|nr:BlaI/MecI/CopY family transcriptional regulator [Dyadobacter sp. CECT 9275]CAG4990647.1 hypothetical protein DYBT9275_00579 [Dyadobacter sp. CECT 9275]
MQKLTAQEEETMRIIWKVNGGFVKDFLDLLPEPSPYTTVASIVKNLERKGYVRSEKLGNTYRYDAVIEEQDYAKRFMSGFVSDYFRNSYKEMVAFFVNEKQISAQELKEVIDMIENKKSS